MGVKRVAVAMSGGVDSSVTAALLSRRGYEVIGVTMKLTEEDDTGDAKARCCSLRDVRDARLAAEAMGIPHYIVDFRELFRERVISGFLGEYARGRTPNPCVACNRYIKFGAFLEKALSLGADYVATGHYARIAEDGAGGFLLKKGTDEKKDQSYVLYGLNQESLRHVMMPLGEYEKSETRRLAAELGLPVANKPDSQEICFIPDDDYHAYIRANAPECLLPGEIVDTAGNVLGRHNGVALYTVGQRKGLGVFASEPRYVVALDAARRRVVVGGADDVWSRGLMAEDVNWIAAVPPGPFECAVKIRYGKREARCIATPMADGGVRVDFESPQRAVSPGQSAVLYDGDVVLGGGLISGAI